ncbi:MAG: hypothetical protein OEV29_13770 [Thermoleophilia bacterium]|nr:hypothetical protein [Thermoleophilia bacterium]
MPTTVDCLIESGSRRVFAIAAAWPGWCRSERDEERALEALRAYGVRFAAAMGPADVRFTPPGARTSMEVIERVAGNATTDFGAPDGIFALDASPLSPRDLTRCRRVLEACWTAFDHAVLAAEGVELKKGPRGGGRELEAIVSHVVGAEAGYLRRLTGAGVAVDDADAGAAREPVRAAIRAGLDRARSGDLPSHGPRGGSLWTPARFLRRTAWHALDHAWEVEDRSTGDLG